MIELEGQVLFNCDPHKNTKCKKNECFVHGGDCRLTKQKEFSTELEERLIYKAVILGEPKTKKNKPKIIRIHGRPSVIPSDEYARFEADALRQMKRPEEPIAKRVRVVGLFYRSTFRVVDLPNLENALDDILVAGGVIKDDSFKYIYSHDGSRVFGGSKNPRTEVLIYEEVI